MRQNGYYWVVYDGKWTIAEYFGKYWGLAFDENVFYDQDFEEIDERPITREQFKKGLRYIAYAEATEAASKANLEVIYTTLEATNTTDVTNGDQDGKKCLCSRSKRNNWRYDKELEDNKCIECGLPFMRQ